MMASKDSKATPKAHELTGVIIIPNSNMYASIMILNWLVAEANYTLLSHYYYIPWTR
jgi:hypothetical protein